MIRILKKQVKWRKDRKALFICDCKRLIDLKLSFEYESFLKKLSYGLNPIKLAGEEYLIFLEFEKMDLLDDLKINQLPKEDFYLSMRILDNELGKNRVRDSNFLKEKFNEKTLYNPRSPYSASKAASDHLVRAYFHTYGLSITITNCSNNFGPFQDPEKFMSRMITNLIDGKKVKIYGDGLYVRDWLYVSDHCQAIDLVLKKGRVGETYMVGGLTDDVNNLTIAKKLNKLFGRSEDEIDFVKDRLGHDRRYAVDWSKINKELRWKPEYDFDTYLKKTVEWYKNNEWWWRPLKKEAEALYKKTGQI